MGGDTPNLNLKAKAQNRFDAIIVGSGISGGWAAKELCQQGLKVLMLERGRPVEHPHYPTAVQHPWEFPHRGSLTLQDKADSYVQSRHYSFREDNKHFYIKDRENPYQEIQRFDWVRGDVLGGRSLLWARMSFRWSDLDFGANQREGIGCDWPIRYRDLAPWYDYVETFIGVSGQKEGLAHLPDGKFQAPMEMNCVEKKMKADIESAFPDRRVTIGRTANLTAPVQGRGICQYRNLCHRGCPYGAYFSTNASTLPAAQATGNLTVLTQKIANRVLYDEHKGRASGVEVIDRDSHQVEEYYASLIFINAATLGTTFLLLNSISSRFPNGMGNGSDQLGRNLMDHHKTLGASARIEGFEDRYYFGRRPTGIYIPRFRNITDKRKDYIRGYGLQGGAYRSRGAESGQSLAIGQDLKASLEELGPWQVGFTGFGECLPYSQNRVTLNTDRKDSWGRNTLSMDAAFRENEKAMNHDILETFKELFDTLGAKDVEIRQGISFPGNANHEMGTARMGKDPRHSVLNGHNQMHEVPNVFVTDGSCMASSGWSNPSLTYMALTARAAHYAVEQLRNGAL